MSRETLVFSVLSDVDDEKSKLCPSDKVGFVL